MSYAEILGIMAGTLVTGSSLPQIIKNFRTPELVLSQSQARNFLSMFGNLLWLIYSLIENRWEIAIFACISAVLTLSLVIQGLMSNRSFRNS